MAATYVIVTNLTTGTLSVSGDKGIPSVTISGIPGSKTANILMRDLLGNKILCEALSTWITAGTVSITRGGVSLGAADLTAYAQGSDMNRNTYDADDDGIVDSAESIDFASVTTGTIVADDDSLILYDLSATAVRKMTVANFLAKKVFQNSDLQAVAATADVTIFIAPADGTILGAVAVAGTAAAAGEDMAIDVEIGGVSALTAPISITNVSGTTPVLGTVDAAAADFVAGDIIVVARTYTAGGGPTPMANTVVSVWANVAL